MSEKPTTPPTLDGAELMYVMANALTAHINAQHPDLPPLRWFPAIHDDGVLGDYLEGYNKTSEELSAVAAAWAQRLGLKQIDAEFAGRVRYQGPVGTISRVEITLVIDRDALQADLDARKAAREAGEQ